MNEFNGLAAKKISAHVNLDVLHVEDERYIVSLFNALLAAGERQHGPDEIAAELVRLNPTLTSEHGTVLRIQTLYDALSQLHDPSRTNEFSDVDIRDWLRS